MVPQKMPKSRVRESHSRVRTYVARWYSYKTANQSVSSKRGIKACLKWKPLIFSTWPLAFLFSNPHHSPKAAKLTPHRGSRIFTFVSGLRSEYCLTCCTHVISGVLLEGQFALAVHGHHWLNGGPVILRLSYQIVMPPSRRSWNPKKHNGMPLCGGLARDQQQSIIETRREVE